MENRIEKDSFGPIEVPAGQLWGAQTQRSLHHFHISSEKMAPELVAALAQVKRAAAAVNRSLGKLPQDKADAIIKAADEVLDGRHPAEFPLSVWQTGSGTQSNMNMNEVLANRASELLGGDVHRGREHVVRGLAHVDVVVGVQQARLAAFAAALAVAKDLLPALAKLRGTLEIKSRDFAGIVKIGRTHLQDATPLTLGQEFSGYVAQLEFAEHAIKNALPGLLLLAAGGTAVGTGLNAHPEFANRIAAEISSRTGLQFKSAPNKFMALAGHDAMVQAHGAFKTLATALMKIANDVRWMASGPRSGLGEITIPENEPGSSIMPGKVNPTQCEAMTMLCCQVFGNDVAITVGGSMGNFELNVFKPMIAHNFLQSARLLADGMRSFDEHCAVGIEPDRKRIGELMEQSLMLVTALAPHIGYDRAAQIAKTAQHEGLTLRQAALQSGFLDEAQFDQWIVPIEMTRPHPAD
jgi:fumarate hydratase class II